MPRSSSQLLAKVTRWLKRRFPLTFPVRVYVRPAEAMDDHLGYLFYDEDKERAVIAIAENADVEILIDSLIEEWAHARTYFLTDTEDHSDDPWHHAPFWSEYGRIVYAARGIDWGSVRGDQ